MAGYEGTQQAADAAEGHLGGNIVEGDPFTFAPKAWNYLIERFMPRSLLDLGSGMGHAAAFFQRRGLAVVAVDGLRSNVLNAIYPTVEIDLTRGPISCKVDMTHCQEVEEHIEERFL